MSLGYADLPLHTGRAPPWLFCRMKRLAGAILDWMEEVHGPETIIERLSSPLWFQAFSCVLGFDWHSSGTTSTTIGAIREGYRGESLKIYGGKGKMMSSFPEDAPREWKLTHSIFSKGLADGYSLYVCSTITDGRNFVVIDQGMNKEKRYARRYHFYGKDSFYEDREKIAGIEGEALNTISKESSKLRKAMVDAANEMEVIRAYNSLRGQHMLFHESIKMPKRHDINIISDLSSRDLKVFERLRDYSPNSYEELLLFSGMGEKKIRALALIANLVYGESIDWRDPVKYSFAHGGKDGIPFPVDRGLYDENIELIEEAVAECKLGRKDKEKALSKLGRFSSLLKEK